MRQELFYLLGFCTEINKEIERSVPLTQVHIIKLLYVRQGLGRNEIDVQRKETTCVLWDSVDMAEI